MARANAKGVWCVALCAVWVLLAIPAAAAAQAVSDTPDCDATPYRFLRYSEDFIFARNPACQTGFWDAMKYLPLSEDGEQFLTLGGDLRVQLLNGRDNLANNFVSAENVLLERIHLHGNLRWSSALRVFAELKSNFEQNREPRPLPADVDRLDIHQAFVDFGTGQSSELRLGRQELLYGSGRRIFPRNGPNVRGNFDGARWTMPLTDTRVDAFLFRPVSVDPGVFDDGTIKTETYWGLYGDAKLPAIAPLAFDAYYIGARRHQGRFIQGVATEHRHSIGARLFGKSGAWDFDHELTAQWGSFGSGSIQAWAVQSESGYSWPNAPFKPRASLRLTFGSGDRNPADPDLQTFNTLFTRGGAVTEAFNVAVPNMTHARLALDAELVRSVTAVIALETMWRTSTHDGVYGPGGNILRGSSGTVARHIGDDIDAIVIWRIDRHAAFSLQVGHFLSGQFIKESGEPRDLSFATATFFYRF